MRSIPTLKDPTMLSTTVLIEEVRREIQCFQRAQSTHGDIYALELLRRALVERNEAAWAGLYTLYERLVGSWILHVQPRPYCFSDEEVTSLVGEIFTRFARNISAYKFAAFADSVPALLLYLKRCASTVTANAITQKRQREKQQQGQEASLEELAVSPQRHLLEEQDPADLIAESDAAEHLWRLLLTQTHTQEERLVLHAICTQITPLALHQQYPMIFASTKDIYRIKTNIIGRCKRNPRLQTMQRSNL